jgi:hypothetical protein
MKQVRIAHRSQTKYRSVRRVLKVRIKANSSDAKFREGREQT